MSRTWPLFLKRLQHQVGVLAVWYGVMRVTRSTRSTDVDGCGRPSRRAHRWCLRPSSSVDALFPHTHTRAGRNSTMWLLATSKKVEGHYATDWLFESATNGVMEYSWICYLRITYMLLKDTVYTIVYMSNSIQWHTYVVEHMCRISHICCANKICCWT